MARVHECLNSHPKIVGDVRLGDVADAFIRLFNVISGIVPNSTRGWKRMEMALQLARWTGSGLPAVPVDAVGVASSFLAFFLGDSLGILARYGLVVSVALSGERAE
jgi:hypothetical protein